MRRWRKLAAPVGVLALAAAALAGCGTDNKGTSAGGGTDKTDGAQAPPVLTVTATDDVAAKQFKFDVPATIEGGVFAVELKNNGKEAHDFQLAKAVEGHTLDDLLKQVAGENVPLEPWVSAAGGAGFTAPGGSGKVTLDLPAGKYWYFCTESSGDDGQPSVPHATNGMSGELTLEGNTGAAMPESEKSIDAADYSLTPTALASGSNTILLSNKGKQLHHALAVPLAAGKTFDEAKAALTSDKEPAGPPPLDFEHGLASAVIDGGQTIAITWDLKPGTYALLCFMPDKGTAGPPHVAKGMLAELKVS